MTWKWSVGRVVHSGVETLLNCASFSLSLTLTVAVFCLAYCIISMAVFVWHTVSYLWQYFVWCTVTYLWQYLSGVLYHICGSICLVYCNISVAVFCLAYCNISVAVFCLAYCNISVVVFCLAYSDTVNVTYLIICGSVLSGVNATYV